MSTGRAQGLGQSVHGQAPSLEAGAFDPTTFFLFIFSVALVPPVRRMGTLMPGRSAPLLGVIWERLRVLGCGAGTLPGRREHRSSTQSCGGHRSEARPMDAHVCWDSDADPMPVLSTQRGMV